MLTQRTVVMEITRMTFLPCSPLMFSFSFHCVSKGNSSNLVRSRSDQFQSEVYFAIHPLLFIVAFYWLSKCFTANKIVLCILSVPVFYFMILSSKHTGLGMTMFYTVVPGHFWHNYAKCVFTTSLGQVGKV